MRFRGLILTIASVAILSSFPGPTVAAEPQSPVSGSPVPEIGEHPEALKVTLAQTPSTTLTSNDKVFTLTVRNTASYDVRLWLNTPIDDYVLTVMNSHGEVLPRQHDPLPAVGLVSKHWKDGIASGASFDYRGERFSLDQFGYDLANGTYTVQAVSREQRLIRSNVLTIVIGTV